MLPGYKTARWASVRECHPSDSDEKAGASETVLPQTPCAPSRVGLGKHLPIPAPEVSRPTPAPDGIRSGCSTSARRGERSTAPPRHQQQQKRVHQGAPDAVALKIRKDANRPHGNNWVGGDGRLARRNVPDHAIVG